MANEQYTSPNMSRSEEIVQATIDGTEYNKPSQSRLETLLIELKEAVEAGGGESSDYATALSLTIDSSTYIITARLLNKDGDTLGTAQTIDLPLESVVMSGYYNSYTQMIVLTLQSGSTIEFSVADLVDGLQTEITSTNKLNADLVDDSTSTNKFVTSAEKSTWNNKQNVLTVGTNLDDEPIEDSENPITSGGVYNTVGNLDAALDSLIMSLEPKTITANGTYDPADDGVDGYSEVTVNVQSGGGGGSTNDDVVFYDYDGSVVASYSAADFANLSAMPTNPTHEGLTAQGWNWSLANAKAYVAACGKLNIGQMYITSDGKTRAQYTVTKHDYSDFNIYPFGFSNDADYIIDWGDGSSNKNNRHQYSNPGNYTVTIEIINGEFEVYCDIFLEYIREIKFGIGLSYLGYDALSCAVATITIPNSVTSIGERAFEGNSCLTSLTIPNSVTTIEAHAFDYCTALASVTIPNSVTSIGEGAFYNCGALASVTIPNSVTSIGEGAFYNCFSLKYITFATTTPPTIEGDLNLPQACIIRIPRGTLTAYTSAANYPDPSNYIYEEY